MYLYSPQSIPTVKCQLSIFVLTERVGRCDWTRPIGGNGRFENQGR
jgi:hypothetical protein